MKHTAKPGRATMTAAEVCELVGCTDRTLRNWLRDGRFPPPLRIGRRKLWPRRLVESIVSGAR